jgi:hypothetical protein
MAVLFKNTFLGDAEAQQLDVLNAFGKNLPIREFRQTITGVSGRTHFIARVAVGTCDLGGENGEY